MIPTYPARKNSGVESLGEIPSHWTVTNLKRALSEPLKYGANEPGDESDPDSPRYLRITDFDGDGNLRADTFVSLPEEIARHYYLCDGDVLFARSGATVGKTFLFRNYSGRACFAGYLIKASTNRSKLAPEFLTYFTRSPAYDAWKDSIFTQATIQNIGADKYARLPLCLPPLPEQQRIAAYLDASCAAIDAAVAAKRRQLQTLSALRTSIISLAVTQGLNPSAKTRASGVSWLGNIPDHWQNGHLKRYARRIQTGVTPPTDTPEYYEDGTIPWFAPGSFETQIELTEPRKLINESAISEGVLRMFPAGSVFVIGIGATIGKVGIIAEEASCNQQIIGIVCDHRMTPRFLAYQLKIYEVVIPGICVATTLPIFNQVQVGYLPVVVPPVSEQQAICDHIETKLGELKKVVGVLETQIGTLIAYRKSLIHECVTGQRRITEEDINRVEAHG